MTLRNSVRNFCIIAHIDHGKSTLADRLLEITGTVEKRQMKAQVLDQMDLERERGITIKLQPVRMNYETGGQRFELNLIDTPGHVDFSYEVSRSLSAVEGALLVVDASQGVQAQTLATLYQAVAAGLTIVAVINKIDLPHAEPDKVAHEIAALLGVDQSECLRVSGKTGEGVAALLDAVVSQVPAPEDHSNEPLRALVFDSVFDTYRGVLAYVRVVSGVVSGGEQLQMMATKAPLRAEEVGFFRPGLTANKQLTSGDIGYIVTGLKDVRQSRVGDTVTSKSGSAIEPLPGYAEMRPVIFAGVYPTDTADYEKLREALQKLSLSDASLSFEPESSGSLGFGFQLGLLGLLHLEIVQERLEREYDLDLVITTPSVGYEVVKTDGSVLSIRRASGLPNPTEVAEIKEPWVALEIVTPPDYIGTLMELAQGRRGIYKETNYLEEGRAILKYELPLVELVTDFYDQVKTRSAGYASLSYEPLEMRSGKLVKIDIMVEGEPVDALSMIVDRAQAETTGRVVLVKLKEVIPRQLFKIALQATIGGKIIAREDIPSLGKNVTAKLYGGDVTRKNKLLKKQKAGKKRLKQFGKVTLPQEAFTALLSRD